MKPTPPTTPASPASEMHTIALRIASGDMTCLPRFEHNYLTPEQWREAAHDWLDGSDRTALPHALYLDERFQEYHRWLRVDYEPRQYADFLTWLDEREAWARDLRKTPVRGCA